VICDDKFPQLSVRLPLFVGGRFQAVREPVVQSPIFSLRIPSKSQLDLEQLASRSTLSLTEADLLAYYIKAKKNIIIAGVLVVVKLP
jgi:Flp pilus assembly CpaF family ATPase